MSTLDQAFIRAYSKDADMRGAAEPAWYRPGEEPHAWEQPADDPRLSAWRPLDQLYAEGIWYRIEPPQAAPPAAHFPVRAAAGPRAQPVRRPAVAPAQAFKPVDSANSVDSADAMGSSEPPGTQFQDDALSSQYLFSATVDVTYAAAMPPLVSNAGATRREGHRSVVAPVIPDDVAPPVEVEVAVTATPAKHTADPPAPAAQPSAAPSGPARLDTAAQVNIPAPHFPVSATDQTDTTDQTDQPAAQQHHAAAPQHAPPRHEAPRHEAPPISRPSAAHEFNSSWEVDALAWPELVERLLRRETRRFTLLNEQLAEAARTGRNVIAVTSASREQGRTTLALCLARRAAASGMRVALVDADFENPQLAQQLRVNPTCGWHDTVTARLPLTEAAVASTRDNVTLLPLRVASVAQADAAVDPVVVTELIDRLSRAFDLVIFDMEPVEPGETVESGETDELDVRAPAAAESPTAATRLHQALAALLVYDASSSEQQLADSIAQLRSAGIETLGAVENFFAPGAAS